MSDSAFAFDRIARSYDRLNHLLSLGIDRLWRRRAVRAMQACEGLLDVAIGTGDLALEVMRQHKAKEVVGIDLSREMMAIGEKKAHRAGQPIQFQYASALDMPFEDNRFDAVTCAYGVRNFTDLDKGLQQMYRVLKDGGQVVILEFSYPDNRFLRWMYKLYFENLMPLVGQTLSGDKTAYRYFFRSVDRFIWGEEFVAHLKNAGFTDITCRPMTFGISTLYIGTK